jgi:UDP-N-acetyl-D-glucosamine dehydrogenase
MVKAREIGAPMRFIDLATEVNLSLPSYFVGIATGILGGLSGKKIIVIGVAYKPGVTDTRETPALTLIELLRSAGALVEWHDDLVDTWNGERSVGLSDEYDLAILVNPHEETDLSVLGKTAVLNTRGGY